MSPRIDVGFALHNPDESDEEGNVIEENDIIHGFNQEDSSSGTNEFDEEYL